MVPSVIVGLSPWRCAPPQKEQLPCNVESFLLSIHTPPSDASIHSSSSQPFWVTETREERIGTRELKVREEKMGRSKKCD